MAKTKKVPLAILAISLFIIAVAAIGFLNQNTFIPEHTFVKQFSDGVSVIAEPEGGAVQQSVIGGSFISTKMTKGGTVTAKITVQPQHDSTKQRIKLYWVDGSQVNQDTLRLFVGSSALKYVGSYDFDATEVAGQYYSLTVNNIPEVAKAEWCNKFVNLYAQHSTYYDGAWHYEDEYFGGFTAGSGGILYDCGSTCTYEKIGTATCDSSGLGLYADYKLADCSTKKLAVTMCSNGCTVGSTTCGTVCKDAGKTMLQYCDGNAVKEAYIKSDCNQAIKTVQDCGTSTCEENEVQKTASCVAPQGVPVPVDNTGTVLGATCEPVIETCSDGNTIVSADCLSGTLASTGVSCNPAGGAPNCERDYIEQCVDGSQKTTQTCIGGSLVPNGVSCATQTFYEKYSTYIWLSIIGIIVIILVIALVLKNRK